VTAHIFSIIYCQSTA